MLRFAILAVLLVGCVRMPFNDCQRCDVVCSEDVSLDNLNDPILDCLLDRAWEQNLDLKIARLMNKCVEDEWRKVSSDIAKQYIELRGLQERLKILQNNIDAQTKGLQLVEGLLSRGIRTEFDLSQIEGNRQALNAQNPLIELEITKTLQRLAILVGDEEELCVEGGLPMLPTGESIAIQSELLRRRPDVRKAEKDLVAALGRRAVCFPQFCLTGNPEEVLFPTFCVEKASRTQRLAIYAYQKTVLEAIEEVENALATYRSEWKRNASLAEAYQTSKKSLELIDQLSDRGLKDYLDELAISRSLFADEEALLESRIALLLDYVALYASL